MSSSFEKSVKGATKIKNAPPKTKYIEHILVATHSGEAGVGEVIRALQYRLRDSTWTIVFKGLITVHLMIREGSPDVTLAFLAKSRNSLFVGNFTDAHTQGRNIRHYAQYLTERVRSYRETKTDWVRVPETTLEKLSVDKGLLRQTESIQRQLTALLKCDVLDSEPENEITITVFRLLVLDLLALFQVLNQGLINILGQFFEMSKPDAERAMEIYRTFTKQTDFVVAYLSVARQHEHHTRVQVPKLKHAPVHLGRQLEDYLNDPDFEIHRRQYIAEQDAKRLSGGGIGSSVLSKPPTKSKDLDFPTPADNNPFPKSNGSSSAAAKATTESQPKANKGPDPDLIDFFDSIEDNQTTMQVNPPPATVPNPGLQQQPAAMPFGNDVFAQQPQLPQQQPQITGFPMQMQPPQMQSPQQQQAPQIQQSFTGAGFGGFSPQQGFQPGSLGTIPQSTVANFQYQGQNPAQPMQTGGLQPNPTGQQTTNPFRQSMLMTQQTGMPAAQPPLLGTPTGASPALQRQSTNPFARSSPQSGSPYGSGNNSPFQSPPPAASPLKPTPTGTNPFARNASPQASATQQTQRPQTAGAALLPQPTGSTNPFRQGAFVNHTTGLGWQHNQQPIGGGLDMLPTQQVFPRPAQQTPWQQQ